MKQTPHPFPIQRKQERNVVLGVAICFLVGAMFLTLIILLCMAQGCASAPAFNEPTQPLPGDDGLLNSGDFGPKLYNGVDGEEVDSSFVSRYRVLLPKYGGYLDHMPAPDDAMFPMLPDGHYFLTTQEWLDTNALHNMSLNPGKFPEKPYPAKP